MRRLIALLTILVLGLAVACGGDDGDSSDPAPEASPAATATEGSTSSGGGSTGSGDSKDGFCTPDNIDAVFDGFEATTDLADLETQFSQMSDILDDWADGAPSEIKDDAQIIARAVRGLIELFEENDYDIIAVGTSATDDPRVLALDSDEFVAATDRLSEYCGYDIAPPLDGPTLSLEPGSAGDLGDGTLPDDFPAELIPPDSTVEFAGLIGPGIGAQFTSTATIDKILAFYEDVLGPPTVTSDESTIWSIFEDNTLTTATISGVDGNVDIAITISSP
jgi:hypothetical protein